MLRNWVLFAGALAVAATAHGITVDGDISDWPGELKLVDSDIDADGEAEMLSWGAKIEGGMLYGYFEMDTSISFYASGTNDIWAGLWINVDGQGGPGDTDSSLGHTSDDLSDEWDGVFEGFDIAVEWGVNEGSLGQGYNFRGGTPGDPASYDDVSKQGNAVVGGQTAYDNEIIEFSCPISEILAELASDHFSDNVTPAADWTVGARVEASLIQSGPWGGDNSDTILLVSAPSAFAPGDFNEDGSVDTADYTVWADNYTGSGGTGGTPTTGDANNDGAVDTADYTLWADNYTGSPAAAGAVPEPGAVILLGAGALLVLLRRRRE